MYNSPGTSTALLSITVGIGFKLSPKEVRNPLFDFDSPTLVVAFLSLTLKVAASALATRIFYIPFYFSSNECHLLLEILAILSKILGDLIAITQTSMKRMLAYSSIGQIGYVIIGIIVGDSNDGYARMITYMLFYISMNLGTFASIVSFGPRTGTDYIRDYAGLYIKDPCFGSLFSLMSPIPMRYSSISRFFQKTPSIMVWMASEPIFLGFDKTPYERCFYLLLSKKTIKLFMIRRNKEITPHVQNYRRSPLRLNNSIELSMIVCVIASTIPEILMNPIIVIF
ncbi:hypothetical protein AMTRI_Chr10g2930 [Amborella trichopoda]